MILRAGLWPLVLAALLLMATVPQGMMRVGGEEGTRLVLCTGNGPTEIWLGPDGEPIAPEDDAQDAPHCVQVQGAELPPLIYAQALRDAERSYEVVVKWRDQIAAITPLVTQVGPRAPPAFV